MIDLEAKCQVLAVNYYYYYYLYFTMIVDNMLKNLDDVDMYDDDDVVDHDVN